MSIFFIFQSGTKKTLKPVVSDEIVNEAKAKVCNTAPGGGGGGHQQMFKHREALP